MTPLLTKIESHLRATQVSPTRFGRDAARDPRLVFDLRNGREPRDALTLRLLSFIAATATSSATPTGEVAR